MNANTKIPNSNFFDFSKTQINKDEKLKALKTLFKTLLNSAENQKFFS